LNRRNERKTSKFLIGFVSGMLFTVLLVVASVFYLIKNPQKVMNKAFDMGVRRAVVQTLRSIPRDYIHMNKDEMVESVNHFLQAYSEGRLSSQELQDITQKAFAAIADQKITPEEIDEILKTMNQHIQ
jgi:hypothetical protein